MSNVVSLSRTKATAVQLSAYPQDDGGTLYAVEVLNSDDTWEILDASLDKDDGWLRADAAAVRLNIPLLPVSTFPGRAA